MLKDPIPLYPAYRSGAQTPWGGDRLKSVFHKPIPDDHTGESLEMSVIPGLESVDDAGNTLSALIARYGSQLTGTQETGAFPLLLKLIDARERLSVQVHPDDAYASIHEGKLGKTEAWVILRADPGAQLIYGMQPGVTLEALREACGQGREIEKLMRFVPVKEGDVLYIPAGTVHAICGGILLYEIQQSSDVTYRFYDWDRVDAQGNHRPLHIRQALDVTRLDLCPEPATPLPVPDAHCRREMLLDTAYFTLERLTDCKEVPLSGNPLHFAALTLLTEGMMHTSSGVERTLPAGQTVLVPAACAPFTLTCGQCLLAAPAHKTL